MRLKSSTLCAGGSLLVLAGFMTFNLAGCGGGGSGPSGGSPFSTPTPANSSVNIAFQLLKQDGTAAVAGNVALKAGSFSSSKAVNASGIALFKNITPGVYTVTFTVKNAAGAVLSTTTKSITITTANNETYALLQDDTGNGNFLVRGKVLLNPDDGDRSTDNCASTPVAVTARLRISVRDLSPSLGSPIIASITRSFQPPSTPIEKKGLYTISIPYRPTTFHVEAEELPGDSARYAGVSRDMTYRDGRTLEDNVIICTNPGTDPNIEPTPPGPRATATPTATDIPVTGTPTPTRTPTGTPTATPIVTASPTPIVTASPTPTTPG